VASSYRFFLTCVWVTLFFLFALFVWFVQQTVLCASSSSNSNRKNPRVFHPAVHAVAGWVQRQVRDLRDDFTDYYDGLMLANEAAYDSYNEAPTAAVKEGNNLHEKKPRSALFRMVFKPVLNVAFRGRRKRRKQRKEEAAARAASATSYVPPQNEETNNETELV